MYDYELMVIPDPSIDERIVAPTVDEYLAPMSANNGSVDEVDIWDKCRLAYDILKRSEDIHVIINMTTTPDVTPKFDHHMSLGKIILYTKLPRPDVH